MKKQIWALVPLVFCFAAGIEAAPILYVADLGDFENPANGSTGIGVANVVFDAVAHTMEVDVTFQDLLGNVTASHIHCCVDPPGNIGVATQVPTFIGFPLGVTSGAYFNIFDTSLASTWNPAFITSSGGTVAMAEARLAQGLADGRAYFNIHTNRNPGGEIRGFLALPEPGTLGLIVLGLGTLATATRKRRA
jgi:hypothetical protein